MNDYRIIIAAPYQLRPIINRFSPNARPGLSTLDKLRQDPGTLVVNVPWREVATEACVPNSNCDVH
jgi:hypothetical protein